MSFRTSPALSPRAAALALPTSSAASSAPGLHEAELQRQGFALSSASRSRSPTPTTTTDGAESQPPSHSPQPKSALSNPRIYRACIHCRQRKSKCELDAVGQPGVPPCRRCVREQRECILAGSRRGGRRPKRVHTESNHAPEGILAQNGNINHLHTQHSSPENPPIRFGVHPDHQSQPHSPERHLPCRPQPSPHNAVPQPFATPAQPTSSANSITSAWPTPWTPGNHDQSQRRPQAQLPHPAQAPHRQIFQQHQTSSQYQQDRSMIDAASEISPDQKQGADVKASSVPAAAPALDSLTSRSDRRLSSTQSTNPAVDAALAAANIQNPSDALEILAQVAGGAQSNSSLKDLANVHQARHEHGLASPAQSPANDAIRNNFPPVQAGIMSVPMIHQLLAHYYESYHPFFPLVPAETFEPSNLTSVVVSQPHLFAAILTIASIDHFPRPDVHQACLAHMRNLISDLLYGGDADVQAVEALLILAEWSTWQNRLDVKSGKSQEDRSAWMLVGTAVRLGYLLGLDQCGFRREQPEKPSSELLRGRLVWSACYMADRQVSIRCGRGFWSRGPGPGSNFMAEDFPSLKSQHSDEDDQATVFKANLELTQLFSNAHDVLYSTRAREMKLILAGDYVKYIDDFRASIRGWHSKYGTLTCSSRLKVSLTLTYDYLRLYVNAFAFQATFARLGSIDRDAQSQRTPATLPDARFIYESIDAAKSLLTTLNNFVDPQTCLRYLPLRYYLYVVHGTVFLYKALATGSMSKEEIENVRRMVVETILRLRQADTEPAHIGSRYAQLISLLWRRPPRRSSPPGHNSISTVASGQRESLSMKTEQPNAPAPSSYMSNDSSAAPTTLPHINHESLTNAAGMTLPDQSAVQPITADALDMSQGDFFNTFSWLDLDSVGHYATAVNGVSPGIQSANYLQFDDETVGNNIAMTSLGQNPANGATVPVTFDTQMIDSHHWFNDQPQNLVF